MPDSPSDPTPVALPAPRRAVVVLGMHRSGTSVVAGCLRRLGVDFGPRLMPPNADNPRGYFEHNDVVNLHDRLLLAFDRSWDEATPLPAGWATDGERLAPYRTQLLTILRRDFGASPLWGLKDPRLCRLLPWWETIWPELGVRPLFVLVRRAPAEVVASLARRDGMCAAKAALLWLRHTLEAEQASRSHTRLILDFSDFLRDEDAALEPVWQTLGLSIPTTAAAAPVVDPTLGRKADPSAARQLSAWITEADEALCQGISGHEAGMRERLNALSLHLQAAEPFLFPGASAEVADLRQQLAATRKQARWYEAEWRKAQAKFTAAQTRPPKGYEATVLAEQAVVSKKRNESKLINPELSNLIKHREADGRGTNKIKRLWQVLRGR